MKKLDIDPDVFMDLAAKIDDLMVEIGLVKEERVPTLMAIAALMTVADAPAASVVKKRIESASKDLAQVAKDFFKLARPAGYKDEVRNLSR